MLIEKTFYYVRHGETDWNRQHRVQGQADIPLNVVGVEQAWAASKHIRDGEIIAIYTSPLSRAIETAKCFQKALGCGFEVLDDLTEFNIGVCDGAIRSTWFDEWKAGDFVPEGAERYDDFIQRALRGINLALAHPGPVLIVAHGGVYGAIKQYAGIDPKFSLRNCRVLRHDPPVSAARNWQVVEIG